MDPQQAYDTSYANPNRNYSQEGVLERTNNNPLAAIPIIGPMTGGYDDYKVNNVPVDPRLYSSDDDASVYRKKQDELWGLGASLQDRQWGGPPMDTRNDQYSLAKQYQNLAFGHGNISPAEELMKAGIEKAGRQAVGSIGASRGGAEGLVLAMQAMRQASDASSDMARQAAALRAQERESAVRGLAALYQNIGAQDMGRSNLSMQQQEMNDRASMGARNDALRLAAMRQSAFNTQLQANMQYQRDLMDSMYRPAEMQLNANKQLEADRRAVTNKMVGTAIEAGSKAAFGGAPTPGGGLWHTHPTNSSLLTDTSLLMIRQVRVWLPLVLKLLFMRAR